MDMTPIRAAGTLDLTVHLRDPDIEPEMRPAGGAHGFYRAITRAEQLGQSGDVECGPPRHRSLLGVREWEGHAGATVCGKPLLLEELWVDHDVEPGDRCCPSCFDGEPVDDDPDLWSVTDFDADEEPPGRSVETVTVVGGVL